MSVAINKVLADRYQLVEQIGMGGMAIVYRAIDQRTGHNVAVKVLRPEFCKNAEFVSRFQREAEAASKMTHHNIVNLLDVGMDGENRYLVMEYVEGKTLKQVIEERGRISPTTAAQITIRILSALAHAHQNGIIHRDIKPQNILVNADGHIKVADFGIARMANSATLTTGNNVMGSVHYYSPEQASGQAADVRSDIYSVGVVFYEMLTGKVPFDGDTLVSIAMQHMYTPPAPVESISHEVPNAISHVCMMAMEKNPKYRYQSAKEMAAELRMALEGRDDEMQPRLVENTEMPMSPVAAPGGPAAPRNGDTLSGMEAQGKKRRKKPRRRINIVWWLVTTLVTAGVFYGIYAGGMAIYDQVVNSVEIPDFVTMEVTNAKRAAQRVGLKIETVEINHPTIGAGVVILQAPEYNPDKATTMKKGDTVVLTVSKGPASQLVPPIVGMTINDAITAAKALGLTITVVERVVSGDVQADFVMSQVPEANTQCQPGDIIQVTVSGGLVNVPNVGGRKLSDAQELLTGCGLTVSTTVQFVDTENRMLHGTVAQQSIPEGTQVIQGTGISLTVYQVPGMTHSEEVTLDLPVSDGMISVRVTLEEGGSEYTVYQGEFPADVSRHPTVTLTAQLSGSYTYRVYCNGSFAYSKQIDIQ